MMNGRSITNLKEVLLDLSFVLAGTALILKTGMVHPCILHAPTTQLQYCLISLDIKNVLTALDG